MIKNHLCKATFKTSLIALSLVIVAQQSSAEELKKETIGKFTYYCKFVNNHKFCGYGNWFLMHVVKDKKGIDHHFLVNSKAPFNMIWTQLYDEDGNDGSLVQLIECDQEESKYRVVLTSHYPEPRLGGKSISSNTKGSWQYILPDSTMSTMCKLSSVKNSEIFKFSK